MIGLRRSGIFAVALMKQWHYWPKHIDIGDINELVANKDVDLVDCLDRALDGEKVRVICQKGFDYVRSLMTLYGILQYIAAGAELWA